jgi:hypothetical protein
MRIPDPSSGGQRQNQQCQQQPRLDPMHIPDTSIGGNVITFNASNSHIWTRCTSQILQSGETVGTNRELPNNISLRRFSNATTRGIQTRARYLGMIDLIIWNTSQERVKGVLRKGVGGLRFVFFIF